MGWMLLTDSETRWEMVARLVRQGVETLALCAFLIWGL